MVRILLVFLLTTISLSIKAQDPLPSIEFETLTHDFGTINEVDGEVRYTFKFKNRGTAPLVIKAVNTSCGCTTPIWDKRSIPAGASGAITVGFDPTNRGGRSEKQITVVSNAGANPITLKIKVLVVPRPRTIIDDYPFVIDYGVRVTDQNVALGHVTRGAVEQATIGVVNNSTKAVTIDIDRATLPQYVSVTIPKTTLQPSEKSEIKVRFDAQKISKWGDQKAAFALKINGVKQTKQISVWATLTEDFSQLTPKELRDAPTSDYSTYFYHFSQQPLRSKLVKEIYLSNSGVNDLIIRHIDFDPKKVKVSVDMKTIKAGQTATLTITLLGTDSIGSLYQAITVITNDPRNPVQELRVLATIEK